MCPAAKPGGRIRCQYFPAVDKVLFVDDYAVGCRKDLNGILLLDTALQPPVAKPEDVVQLELPVTEVSPERHLGDHGLIRLHLLLVPVEQRVFTWSSFELL